MFVGLKSFGYSMLSKALLRVVRKLRSASCVDDVPCVHNGIGYLFPVVPTVVVVAVWLRARSLICLWLATSGAMTTRSFLILLVSSVLLFLLLLTLVASGVRLT